MFVTANTISKNGVFTLEKKRGRIDGMKINIFICVHIVAK